MIASFLIIVFSVLLLAYWFRYSCILLLRSHAERMTSTCTVSDIRFCFAEVQARLRTAEALDPLHLSMQRDYEILILVLDYKVMQWCYRITRIAAPQQARRALNEMASVLIVLAQNMGEQARVHTEA